MNHINFSCVKIFWQTIIICLFVGCQEKSRQESSFQQTDTSTSKTNSLFSISEIRKEYFDSIALLPKYETDIDSTSVKKINGQIKLQSDNASDPISVFTDNNEEEENQMAFNYLGYYRLIKQHLIETVYYESIDYTFVSFTGNKISLLGVPVFSNDKKYFMTFKSYELEGDPAGLQVWEIRAGENKNSEIPTLNKIIQLDEFIFNPLECIWDKDGSVLIKGESIDEHLYASNDTTAHYWKLKFK